MTRRLLASYLFLTVAVLLVLEIPLGINFAEREEQDLIQGLQIDAFALASFTEGEPGPERQTTSELQSTAEAYARDTGARVVIVDSDGRAIADSDPPAGGERFFDEGRPEIATALEGQVATGTRSSETLGGRFLYAAVPVASGGAVHGAVRITYPADQLDQRVRDNWLRLGLIALVSLAAAAALGVVLARSVTKPVLDLQAAATALGRGELGIRADESAGPSEVRALARDFNDMAVRLEALVGAQEAFVADASHQLRSPLTALRLRLENLEATVAAPDRDEVESAGREVARLSRVVDGLLALARADRASGAATAVPTSLSASLRERADVWGPLVEERGVALDVAGDGTAVVDPDRLAQVVDNLLANALEVAPSGSAIQLRSTSGVDEHAVELHVVDAGPGLSEEARGRAFDRFWRAGGRRPADQDALGGSGLGLAIVQKLVAADGGSVELRSAATGGVDATVTYPAVPAG